MEYVYEFILDQYYESPERRNIKGDSIYFSSLELAMNYLRKYQDSYKDFTWEAVVDNEFVKHINGKNQFGTVFAVHILKKKVYNE